MDFHKGTYNWPEVFTIMAHQVLAADILGDDRFVEHVCYKLKLPTGRINSSNWTQDVKIAIRDKYKLSQMVATLTHSKQTQCYVCKDDFMKGLDTSTHVVLCCGRRFHCSSLRDLKVCPYCNEP